MNLSSIAEFLFRRGRGSGLDELAETRPSVRKTPRRNFDVKLV
jgi:hypothetical protein